MKIFKFILTILAFLFLFPGNVLAQSSFTAPKEEIVKAKVVEIIDEGTRDINLGDRIQKNIFQNIKIVFLDGSEKGKEQIINHGGEQLTITESQKVSEGETIVILRTYLGAGDIQYQIIDRYRINELLVIGIFFFVLVIALSQWKGVGSFLGMMVSLGVIVYYIVPQIIKGNDPLFVSIVGSLVILVVSIYLAHGFSKQTTIAVISTFITLVLAGILSFIFVNITRLNGFGSDEASTLQFGQLSGINFKGLLLGGMIIGFLGVLDDITTGISATVFELKKHNPKISLTNLVKSSLNVGREHISSLVNTLVLAYAGASLPVFLYIVLNPGNYPLWFIINSEMIAEEIVRTLSGSIGLLFAVPITTFLAAFVVTRRK